MIATIINAATVIIGGILGLAMGRKIEKNQPLQQSVFIGIGMVTLVIGMMMALRSQRILFLALSLVLGGIIGELMGIDRAITRLGKKIHQLTTRSAGKTTEQSQDHHAAGTRFAAGFLEASVLFCVGSMAILGSIQAGMEGKYEILLTKSVMDGFMAILLAASLGAGVLWSAVSVLVYQGVLTWWASFFQGSVDPLILSEISGVGGAMILMIGFNLLGIKKIPTANYLPALVLATVFALADPWLPMLH